MILNKRRERVIEHFKLVVELVSLFFVVQVDDFDRYRNAGGFVDSFDYFSAIALA